MQRHREEFMKRAYFGWRRHALKRTWNMFLLGVDNCLVVVDVRPVLFSFSKYVSIVSLRRGWSPVSLYGCQRGWIRNFLSPHSPAGSQGKTHDCCGKRHIPCLSCSGDKNSIPLTVLSWSLGIPSLYSSLLPTLSSPKEEACLPYYWCFVSNKEKNFDLQLPNSWVWPTIGSRIWKGKKQKNPFQNDTDRGLSKKPEYPKSCN